MKAVYILATTIMGVSCLPSHGVDVSRGRASQLPIYDDRIFDQAFALKEHRRLSAKFQDASRFLRGIGLAQDPLYISDSSEDLPSPANFTPISLLAVSEPVLHGDAIIPPIDVPATGTAIMPIRDAITGSLDVLYYGPLQFGSSKQQLTVDIDTGSADLWVPVDCGDCQNDQLDASSSTSFVNSRQKFRVYYGIGEVSGTVAQDTVSISGLTVSGQAFGAVSTVSEDFNTYPNAGILGLAFGSIAQSKKPPFFERLIHEKRLAAPLFSVHLTRNQESGGELCLGCYDASKTKGPIAWVPVQSQTYWSVRMDGFTINSMAVKPRQITAAIDTGTTLIYVPEPIATQFYEAIPGAKAARDIGPGLYTFPCSSNLSISLSFDGEEFSLNTLDHNLGRTNIDSQDCVGGILALGEGFPPDLAIIGDEFLKSWYTTFDYRNGGRVGFSPSVNNN